MISPRLLSIVRCPDCAAALEGVTYGAAGLQAGGPHADLKVGASGGSGCVRCSRCGREFDGSRGYLDLRPAAAFAEQTKYLDEALHADARHASVAPPLLGSRVRNGRLREFLALSREDHALDLGCGSGRALLWNADTGATLAGIDISPFFAHEALDRSDLLLGDLRRLPLRDGAFNKAWSLDVFEHLSPQALRDVLREANRVLAPGGALFVYTHVRKNGWPAGGVRLVNRLARLCERVGLIDLRQERLRKSDHLNPLADHDELGAMVEDAGFHIERITYYTPIVGALIENVGVRIAERIATLMVQRSKGPRVQGSDASSRTVRASAKTRIRKRGPTYLFLRLLSAAMLIDLWLFGRVKSGPFFALLRKPAASGPPPAA